MRLTSHKAGHPVSASALNQQGNALDRLSKLKVAPPLQLLDTASGPMLRGQNLDIMYIRLSGDTSPYAWQEVIPSTNGDWDNGPHAGNVAYEANGAPSLNGKVVRSYRYGNTQNRVFQWDAIAYCENHCNGCYMPRKPYRCDFEYQTEMDYTTTPATGSGYWQAMSCTLNYYRGGASTQWEEFGFGYTAYTVNTPVRAWFSGVQELPHPINLKRGYPGSDQKLTHYSVLHFCNEIPMVIGTGSDLLPIMSSIEPTTVVHFFTERQVDFSLLTQCPTEELTNDWPIFSPTITAYPQRLIGGIGGTIEPIPNGDCTIDHQPPADANYNATRPFLIGDTKSYRGYIGAGCSDCLEFPALAWDENIEERYWVWKASSPFGGSYFYMDGVFYAYTDGSPIHSGEGCQHVITKYRGVGYWKDDGNVAEYNSRYPNWSTFWTQEIHYEKGTNCPFVGPPNPASIYTEWHPFTVVCTPATITCHEAGVSNYKVTATNCVHVNKSNHYGFGNHLPFVQNMVVEETGGKELPASACLLFYCPWQTHVANVDWQIYSWDADTSTTISLLASGTSDDKGWSCAEFDIPGETLVVLYATCAEFFDKTEYFTMWRCSDVKRYVMIEDKTYTLRLNLSGCNSGKLLGAVVTVTDESTSIEKTWSGVNNTETTAVFEGFPKVGPDQCSGPYSVYIEVPGNACWQPKTIRLEGYQDAYNQNYCDFIYPDDPLSKKRFYTGGCEVTLTLPWSGIFGIPDMPKVRPDLGDYCVCACGCGTPKPKTISVGYYSSGFNIDFTCTWDDTGANLWSETGYTWSGLGAGWYGKAQFMSEAIDNGYGCCGPPGFVATYAYIFVSCTSSATGGSKLRTMSAKVFMPSCNWCSGGWVVGGYNILWGQGSGESSAHVDGSGPFDCEADIIDVHFQLPNQGNDHPGSTFPSAMVNSQIWVTG